MPTPATRAISSTLASRPCSANTSAAASSSRCRFCCGVPAQRPVGGLSGHHRPHLTPARHPTRVPAASRPSSACGIVLGRLVRSTGLRDRRRHQHRGDSRRDRRRPSAARSRGCSRTPGAGRRCPRGRGDDAAHHGGADRAADGPDVGVHAAGHAGLLRRHARTIRFDIAAKARPNPTPCSTIASRISHCWLVREGQQHERDDADRARRRPAPSWRRTALVSRPDAMPKTNIATLEGSRISPDWVMLAPKP